jgi:hypothetical protein
LLSRLVAFLAGWQHELEGLVDGQPLAEFWMDASNNREGRRAAAEGRPVDSGNLVTSAESSDYDANRHAYFERAASQLTEGKTVVIRNTTYKLDQEKGMLEARTSETGTRIVEKKETCVDKERCGQ